MSKKRAEAFVKALSVDPRAVLRSSVKQLEKFSTGDSKRLVRKLDNLDIKDLLHKAEILVKEEGTLVDYNEVKIPDIKADLDALLDIQVRRQDIVSWVQDYRQQLLEVYSFARLDWLWDFSWTYLLWGPKYFKNRDIVIYGAIRGHKPQNLHSVPLQAALNRLRKELIRKAERGIYLSAKRGDVNALVAQGLTQQQAEEAIKMVSRASV